MRFIGLDVHRDFCEVAISTGGKARSAGRIDTSPPALRLFASSLAPTDRVVLESTSNALAIARILEPHVAEVVIANPMQVRAICHAKVKNDRFDARTLAELLAVDLLVRQRTRVKNEVSAVLVRNLKGRPPVSDVFGKRGRRWLTELELPADEHDTVAACLRQIDFLDTEIAGVDGHLATHALASTEIKRLMTIPGIDVTTAATLMAAIGDIRRFDSAKRLVGYLGLDARVRQSGVSAARHGRISKEGSSAVRHVLVQAAWAAIKTPGPLRAFYQRIRVRRGAQIAIVAVARKLATLCWQLLTTQQDYAYQRPTLVARKLRALELRADAPRAIRSCAPGGDTAKQRAAHERQLAEQAELAYRRLIADWKATGPTDKAGAGRDTGARISRALEEQSRAADSVSPSGLRFATSITRAHTESRTQDDQRPDELDFHAEEQPVGAPRWGC